MARGLCDSMVVSVGGVVAVRRRGQLERSHEVNREWGCRQDYQGLFYHHRRQDKYLTFRIRNSNKRISIVLAGELCVVKDEYLQVKEVVDRHWARCQTEHRVGLVPMSHVTSVDGIPKLEEGQALYLAVSDFIPDHQGDIRLKRGKGTVF